ncbi:IS110 family transposase [Sphingobacterium mizutaii]|uniref:IS110 family transposase n=1 Tax=Sphingobacterium mizutaii TaxID=1010 RepID=UPI001BE400BA|nr:transposase [Sphingobacterium mizutaii]
MAVSGLPFIFDRGGGVDVHKDTIVATIKGNDFDTETKTFLTFIDDLYNLVECLQAHSISQGSKESTGVYLRPVYAVLEDYFHILLVNARHVKNVPRQKTDKKDSEWITKLLLSGLLKENFIPPQHIHELKELFRHRRKLITMRTAEKKRLQNILESANIKRWSVVSDVFGVSAMEMVRALAKGHLNPLLLAKEITLTIDGRYKCRLFPVQRTVFTNF